MIEEVVIIGTGKVAYHFAKEISNNPKLKLIQMVNIVSGKDRNWDGKVDIADKMIEAKQKSKK